MATTMTFLAPALLRTLILGDRAGDDHVVHRDIFSPATPPDDAVRDGDVRAGGAAGLVDEGPGAHRPADHFSATRDYGPRRGETTAVLARSGGRARVVHEDRYGVKRCGRPGRVQVDTHAVGNFGGAAGSAMRRAEMGSRPWCFFLS